MINFGGGTLDVAIMEFGKGVFKVKATSAATPSDLFVAVASAPDARFARLGADLWRTARR